MNTKEMIEKLESAKIFTDNDTAIRIQEVITALRGMESAERVILADLIDWPEYNESAMGCGLEDRSEQNNAYDAMRYGWDSAIQSIAELVDGKIAFTTPQPVQYSDRSANAELLCQLKNLINLIYNIKTARPYGNQVVSALNQAQDAVAKAESQINQEEIK